MIPGIFLFVYIPWAVVHSVTTGGTEAIVKYVLLVGVGGIGTISVVIVVTIIARRAIMAELEEQKVKADLASADGSVNGEEKK